eukprot:6203975-Pleurochrysis_carterae.AAC.1
MSLLLSLFQPNHAAVQLTLFLSHLLISVCARQGNLAAVAQTIEKNRPSGCKGKLWISATLSSTMGPAIKLDVSALKAFTPEAPAA